jgi:predicted PurR-regulated permease PerM
MLELQGTERRRRLAYAIWSLVGIVALLWAGIRVASSVRIIWLPLAFAGGLVLLLNPAVDALERLRLPRVVAAFISFLVLVGLVVAGGFLLLPVIRRQAADFASALPDLYDSVLAWLEDIGARFGIDLGPALTIDSVGQWLQDPANQEAIQQVLGNFGAGAGRLIRGVTETLAVILLAPILALYILIDLPRTRLLAQDLTPPGHREEVIHVVRQLFTALGGFVRGQLLVAFIVGLASSVGLFLIDLPFWLIIGILAGILNLVPFVGPVVGGALAALVALLNGNIPQALLAIGIFTLIQQTDNHVITPLVQRARVKLSPVVIVLALIVGGSVAGLLGVLVAVPLTAAIRIVAGHLWRTRMLGQSWIEASEHMIEMTPPPDRIAIIRRRPTGGQQRLFDTAEQALIGRHLVADAEAPTKEALGDQRSSSPR